MSLREQLAPIERQCPSVNVTLSGGRDRGRKRGGMKEEGKEGRREGGIEEAGKEGEREIAQSER